MSDLDLEIVERRLFEIVARQPGAHGLSVERSTRLQQDARFDGVDVDDLIFDLEAAFGPVAREIPWARFTDQRASFRGCAVFAFPAWLLWRALTKPSSERLLPPPQWREEQLTMGHLAQVLKRGAWFEPGTDASA